MDKKIKKETQYERIDYIANLHKQNLNGRETEDEIFESGIRAGIEETEEIMHSNEEVLSILYKHTEYLLSGKKITLDEWFEKFKK